MTEDNNDNGRTFADAAGTWADVGSNGGTAGAPLGREATADEMAASAARFKAAVEGFIADAPAGTTMMFVAVNETANRSVFTTTIFTPRDMAAILLTIDDHLAERPETNEAIHEAMAELESEGDAASFEDLESLFAELKAAGIDFQVVGLDGPSIIDGGSLN